MDVPMPRRQDAESGRPQPAVTRASAHPVVSTGYRLSAFFLLREAGDAGISNTGQVLQDLSRIHCSMSAARLHTEEISETYRREQHACNDEMGAELARITDDIDDPV